MKIDKPDDVLLLQGYHARGGQPALMVTLAYTMEADGRAMSEQEVWPWLLTHFTEQPFDMGFKKDRGVFGVAGSAHALNQQPVTAMAVQARVGALQKTLHVHGDRCWEKQALWQPGPAQPFVSMPVTLSRAFGGPDWLENPHGKGWFPGSEPAPGLSLPNIELPDAPIIAPQDRPSVATFGMLPAGAPSRMRWVGRVDAVWQYDRFPWLPDDTDVRWFDGVPSDQGMDAFWQGNEAWSVQGMHPDYSEVSGRLPGLRPRLLVRRHAGDGQGRHSDPTTQISEAALDLDTVWLFPNEQRVMVMYRAAVSVSCEDAADIAALGVFTENQAEAATPWAVLAQNWLAQDHDIQPGEHHVTDPSVSGGVVIPVSSGAAAQQVLQDQFAQASAELQQALDEGVRQGNEVVAEIEAQVRAQTGLDLNLPRIESSSLPMAPAKPDGSGDLEQLSMELEADLNGALQKGQDDMEAIVREIAEQAGQDPEQWIQDMRAVQAMPAPRDELDLVQTLAGLDVPGMPDEIHQELMARAQDFQREINEMDAALAMPASGSATLSVNESEPDEVSQVLSRDQVLERVSQGISLSEAILTELDLSDVVLRAVDMSRALITNCNFTRADLSSAVLDQARLEGCDFTQARLDDASLRQADVVNTCFVQARCVGASLINASISQSDLSGSDWSDASLDGSSLGESMLNEASFAKATMVATNLWAVQGQGVNFRCGQLEGLRIDSHSSLPCADFEQADMQGCSLQDSDLNRAVFNEARLSDALIKNCTLDHSTGWRVIAIRTDLKASSLVGVRWPGANCMEASFDSAHLENVDFSGANLHAAEVRTAVVRGMQVQGALLTRCDLLQRHAQTGTGASP